MTVEQNISRLTYLLSLYKLSVDEFLDIISKGLKNHLTKDDVFSPEIKLSHLKRIDKLFNKGLHFYLDPKVPESSQEASIFFRKQNFNSELNIAAKKIVNQFEDFKISLSAIAKLADINLDRHFPVFRIIDNPRNVARELRSILYPKYIKDLKDFLIALISKFAENNILVFEFVETWNLINRANIDGFYLKPNVIVLKRHQIAFRREIFTLIHELGHYLLNEEEIEKLDYQDIAKNNLTDIEKWCNDFAYYFLAGDYSNEIDKIEKADPGNDYCSSLIQEISQKTHLSKIALYTRLLLESKISPKHYSIIKDELEENFKKKLEEEAEIRKINKLKGIKPTGSTPQPIKSPLLISTIQTAFYEGILNEYEVCQKLHIKPEKLEKYVP